jgi:hypothetical protein
MPFLTADTRFFVLYGDAGRGGAAGGFSQILWASRLSVCEAAACESPGSGIEWREDGKDCPSPEDEALRFRIERFGDDGRKQVALVTNETAAAFITAAEEVMSRPRAGRTAVLP